MTKKALTFRKWRSFSRLEIAWNYFWNSIYQKRVRFNFLSEQQLFNFEKKNQYFWLISNNNNLSKVSIFLIDIFKIHYDSKITEKLFSFYLAIPTKITFIDESRTRIINIQQCSLISQMMYFDHSKNVSNIKQ